jgi:hypothetical protein
LGLEVRLSESIRSHEGSDDDPTHTAEEVLGGDAGVLGVGDEGARVGKSKADDLAARGTPQ